MLRNRFALGRRLTIRSRLATVFVLGALAPADGSRVFAAPPFKSPCIVALGDSTTFGYSVEDSYPKQLEHALQQQGRAARVVNAGVNNDTTQGALRRLKKDVLRHEPDVVLIQFGLNDQTMRLYQRPQDVVSYVALAEFARNLRSLVQKTRERGATPILMTPNPMIWTAALEHHYPEGPHLDPPHGGNRLLAEYVTTVKQIAADAQVPIVDVFAAYQPVEESDTEKIETYYLPDGVHPSEKGYALNVKLLLPEVLKALRNQSTDEEIACRR